jgi:epoxyqueuosine reductase
MQGKIPDEIIEKAVACGATSAGVTTIEQLAAAPSYRAAGLDAVLPEQVSVLVLTLEHPEAQPELDWWDGDQGTPGNRRLIDIGQQIRSWLERTHGIQANDLPYYVQAGGVFLKDAAVLSGLGVVGRNNLFITPEFGPKVRLRAMLIHRSLIPSPPLAQFSPCTGCPAPCRDACPQEAFRDGSYSRSLCQNQMGRDVENHLSVDQDGLIVKQVRYCRACELACPVGS